jgi:condensin-2 complex subunit D3
MMTSVSLDQAVRSCHIDSSFLTLSLKKLRALINSPDVPSDAKSGLAVTSRDCLRVLAKMARFLPFDDAKACFSDLQNELESFTISIDLISTMVHALIVLTNRMCYVDGNSERNDVFCEVQSWVNGLFHCCKNAIESCYTSLAQRGTISKEDEKLLAHILHLIGELSIIGFTPQEQPRLNSSMGKQGYKITLPTDRESVRGLLICPSSCLVHLVKLMLPNAMPMPSANAENDGLAPTPSTLRAHAFIPIGKFCLRDESLAKESLNMFARELHQVSNADPAVSKHPAIAGNCLLVMGDLCVRYTNLGEKGRIDGRSVVHI